VSPSKVRDLSSTPSHRRVTAKMAASHGADCPAECCLYRRSGALGHAAPIVASPFRADRDGLPCDTVPRHRSRRRVHPLVSLALLLSPSCLRRPEHPSRACARPTTTGAFLGVLRPLRGISVASPLTDGHPRPTYVPPSAFRTLSTACSSHCLADLFHPAATSRFRAPGVSSLVPAGPPRR